MSPYDEDEELSRYAERKTRQSPEDMFRAKSPGQSVGQVSLAYISKWRTLV